MAQKKSTSTPKTESKTKTKVAVKRVSKATKTTKAAQASKPTKTASFPNAGQSFDVIPAHKVVPSSSARPVITSSRPAQSDNTLTKHPSVMVKAPVQAEPASIHLAKHTMAAAPKDISSGDVLLEDIAASLEKLQPISKPSASHNGSVTVRVSGPMSEAAASTPSAPTGPTVAELLTAQAKAAPAPRPAPTAPVVVAPTTVVGEKKIMPLTDTAKQDDLASAGQHTTKVKAEKATDHVNAHKATEPRATDKTDQKPAHDSMFDGLDLTQDRNPAASPDEVPHGDGVLPGKTDQLKQPGPATLYGGSSVLLIHEPHPVRTTFKYIFWFIGLLLLALVVLNFLLDAGVVSTGYDIPYTDVLEP